MRATNEFLAVLAAVLLLPAAVVAKPAGRGRSAAKPPQASILFAGLVRDGEYEQAASDAIHKRLIKQGETPASAPSAKRARAALKCVSGDCLAASADGAGVRWIVGGTITGGDRTLIANLWLYDRKETSGKLDEAPPISCPSCTSEQLANQLSDAVGTLLARRPPSEPAQPPSESATAATSPPNTTLPPECARLLERCKGCPFGSSEGRCRGCLCVVEKTVEKPIERIVEKTISVDPCDPQLASTDWAKHCRFKETPSTGHKVVVGALAVGFAAALAAGLVGTLSSNLTDPCPSWVSPENNPTGMCRYNRLVQTVGFGGAIALGAGLVLTLTLDRPARGVRIEVTQ